LYFSFFAEGSVSMDVEAAPSRSLWRNADFLKFWTGETVSLFGAKVTALALPLAAAVTLQATPVQMGILNAAQFAPYLLFTLFAGVLISMFTAPIAILIDAMTYVVSALSLSFIRKKEPQPEQPVKQRSVYRDIKRGLRPVFANPYIRAIACEAATYNFFSQVTWAVLVLYLTRDLQIGPSLLGFMMAAASVGSLLGSLSANDIGRRFATGPTIVGSMLLACSAPMLVPLAHGPLYVVVPVLVLSFFLGGFGLVISNVHVISLRQAIIPQHLLGRINAGYRFVVTGVTPIGALVGGILGTYLGLRLTLLVGAVGTMLAVVWILVSPVAKLRQMPDAIADLEADEEKLTANESG
jgi:hypothetical protein